MLNFLKSLIVNLFKTLISTFLTLVGMVPSLRTQPYYPYQPYLTINKVNKVGFQGLCPSYEGLKKGTNRKL